MITLIKRLRQKEQTGVILITHDLAVAHETCDSIAVLHSGRIVESAAVQEMFNQPRHPYTRQLMAGLRT